MKNLYFVAGLPRSGSTLLINLLKQNPVIHGEAVSSLCTVFSSLHGSWNNIDSNKEYINIPAKINCLKALLDNYHNEHNKEIIFDKDRLWITQIAILEYIYQKQVKMLVPVRNPAEILASFEKIRKNNPIHFTLSDQSLRETSTIPARAYFFAGPNGPMGLAYQALKDSVVMGYLDRLLFVDYNRFCNSPKSQMQRIYDFFELPKFDHNFKKIDQVEQYNDDALSLPNLHKIKPSLQKTTINVVEYLGLDLYEQYNREIFWDAWI
jgi:sulfotransferase